MLTCLLLSLAVAAGVDVAGVVVDPSGAMVAGARVTLARPAGPALSETTGQAGTFRLRAIESGEYILTVEREGFRPAQSNLSVGSRPPARLRIQLDLADFEQKLTVNASDGAVNTEAGENLDVVKFDRDSMGKVPILDNDVVASATQFLDSAALGSSGVAMVVDGMQTSEKGVTASAIQEVRINQNPYSVEYGRPGRGRIEVITKAGTKAYHGAFNFLYRNSVFDARNAFAAERPAEQRRIFEGSLTGPVGRSGKTSLVLSANRRLEDLQSVVFAATPAGQTRASVPHPARESAFNLKLSRQLSEKAVVSVRYEFQDESFEGNGAGGFVLPDAAWNFNQRQHHVYVSHRTAFTSSLVNELFFRGGTHDGGNTSARPGVAKTVVNEAFTGGGAQADVRSTENHFQLTDTALWTRGRHLVKFGVQIPDFSRRGQTDRSNTAGTYYFASLADYSALRPYSCVVQQGEGHLALWQREIGLFVQDEFKLRPDLSLSYGLRWDAQAFLPDRNNFAPRLALAWSPDRQHKTVLRAGGGIFFDHAGEGAISNTLRFDGQHLRRVVLTNPAYPVAAAGLAAEPADRVRFAANIRSAYLGQTGFTVERQLRSSLTLTTGYTYLRGIKSFRSLNLNSPEPPLYLTRPDASVGVLREIQSAGRLASHALDVTLRGAILRQLKGTLQYTAGRAFNDTNGIEALPADSRNLSGEWSRAPFDMRHRVNLLLTVRPEKLLNLGIRFGWNTAAPYTLTTGHDDNRDGTASDRPAGVARNSLTGVGAATLDLRWSKELMLTRSHAEQAPAVRFALDAFNALNHVNYNSPVGNLSSPFFGQPVSARPARRLQLGLEFTF